MNIVKKLTWVTSSIIMLGIVLSSGSAKAASETCTVGTVWYAPAKTSPIGANSDMLVVGCSNDGTNYYIAVGTPAASGCFASVDAIKAMEAIALSAKTSGRTLTIPYYMATCPNLGSVRILSELGM